MKKILAVIIFIAFILSLIFFLRQTVSFSFVDEYDNIVAAYFMTKGKVLFTQVFHNRQPGMVWISYFIQSFLRPNSLYKLIVYHRLFVIGFSLVFSFFLAARFQLVGVLFVLFYEILKYFSHGNLFQGESLAVYPLVYLFGLFLYKFTNKKIYAYEEILAAIFAWFIIFQRETFVPVTLFVYFLILFKKSKSRGLSLAFFIVFSLSTLLFLPLKNYWYQLVTINSGYVVGEEIVRYGGYFVSLLKSFFYPLYTFVGFRMDEYNFYLIFISLSFLAVWFFLWKKRKKLRPVLLTAFFILGFSILRPVEPKPFYAAYKIGSWSALISFGTIYFILEYLPKKYEKTRSAFIFFIIALFCLISVKRVFIETKNFNKVAVFDINYNRYFVNGEVVKILADKNDTLYVDGYDSLVYWQADLPSAYEHIIFYPPFIHEPYFSAERMKMFTSFPPTFYYQDCFDKKTFVLPKSVMDKYSQWQFDKKGTCLFTLKSKLQNIPKSKLEEVKKFRYVIY